MLAAPLAHAVEAEVDSTVAGQFYDVSSPWGSPTLTRRRVLETLGVGVYHLQGGPPVPGGPEISFRLRMRLDSDPGIGIEERTYSATSNRFVPGLAIAPLDLMYGYFEGRNLLSGWLGFRLGRQYVTDVLGFWAFDGGLLRITTPVYLQVEAYGGLEERGGLFLSTPRFEQNGVYRGDRSGFDATIYPHFQQAKIAPAFGAAIESSGVTWIHGRLDYRRVLNQGSSIITQFPDPVTGQFQAYSGSRSSSERLGYALDLTAMKVGSANGGLVYDLYNGFFSTWYAQLDWFTTQNISLGADYEYFRPTFDGDSIFNFFTHNPLKTLTGRASLNAGRHFDMSLSGGIRSFTTDGDPNLTALPAGTATAPRDQVSNTDVLGNLSARYRNQVTRIGLRGMFEEGDSGHRAGGDLSGEHDWLGGRWVGQARVSLYDFRDDLRPDRSATSFGYVLGVGFRPGRVARALVEFEHDMNSLVGQRFRLLAMLSLQVGK